jgi:SAM-dependent methyltransferase
VKADYRQISVLDISPSALAVARSRIGPNAERVQWIAADIRNTDLPVQAFDIWHDRAVFHFLTDPGHRAAYVRQVERAVKPGGHVIVATFAADGPETCSGLPVRRYSPDELHDEFGKDFELVHHTDEIHTTPWGAGQHFIYCHCVARPRSVRKMMRAPSALRRTPSSGVDVARAADFGGEPGRLRQPDASA